MEKSRKGVHVLIIYSAIVIAVIGILGGRSVYVRHMADDQRVPSAEYSKHYALITGDSNEQFWSQVYESAKEKAAEEGAYVEWFGKNLSVSYSVTDFTRMAINAGVDGIILQASENEEMCQLIDKAVLAGIPVVTVLSDCQESSRQAYVGVNNYDVGQVYGEKLLELIHGQFKKNIKIMVAVGGEELTDDQERILMSMRQYVSANLPLGYFIEVTPQLIPQNASFATEEFFNNLFISSDPVPNILICLDERGTKCSYRAAVDHNRVGDTTIIGYYYSKDILAALEKETLDSVLFVDAQEMGIAAAEALLDYQEFGYTNNYRTVSIELMGQEEAGKMLAAENEANELEGEAP